MGKKENLVKRLNDAISEINVGMGPSQTNLILYGPINRNLISSENLNILKSNEKLFKSNYENFIFPKVREIVRVITQDNSDFPKTKKELDSVFKYRTPEDVRKKLRDSYNGQFELDSITAEHLFSEEKICNRDNKGKKFYFDRNSEYMFGKRYKMSKRIEEKLCINFEKMTPVERADFLNFVVNVTENNYVFWSGYNKYAQKYSKENLDMMLGDLLGVKIVDLNQKRAEKNMNRMANNYNKADFHNFSVVEKRFYDRRWRNKEERPGGIHCTLIDKMLPTYPIEVHYSSIKDECANLFGKHAHHLYNLRGKKSNPVTGD